MLKCPTVTPSELGTPSARLSAPPSWAHEAQCLSRVSKNQRHKNSKAFQARNRWSPCPHSGSGSQSRKGGPELGGCRPQTAVL